MKKAKKIIGYTTGVFDLFHIGHLNILRSAKQQCDYLIVGVTSDDLCFARKNKYPVMPLDERIEIIKAIKYVDEVVIQEDMIKLAAVKKYKINIVFVGSDWQGTPQWKEYENQFKEVGCNVVYLPHTTGISTTMIVNSIRNSK